MFSLENPATGINNLVFNLDASDSNLGIVIYSLKNVIGFWRYTTSRQ